MSVFLIDAAVVGVTPLNGDRAKRQAWAEHRNFLFNRNATHATR